MKPDEVFAENRPTLLGLAYRMLGSIMDAEDCVQEAFLRWRRIVAEGGEETIQSPRTYLCSLVTHLCIDQLRSARVRREAYVGVWLPEPVVTLNASSEEAADPVEAAMLGESLSMAFMRLLERLSPVERAVFLLHQVFGYEYEEIAAIVDKSVENCRQISRRAQQHLASQRPRFDTGREERERITSQFIQTCGSGDMQGLIAMLSEDIVLYSDGGGKVHAAIKPVFGREKVARMLIRLTAKSHPGTEVRVVSVNGSPGVVLYLNGTAFSVLALEVGQEKLREIEIIVNPEKLQSVPLLSN